MFTTKSFCDFLAVGKAHGAVELHSRYGFEFGVFDAAGASVVTVDEVFDFGEHVILGRFDYDVTVTFVYVFFIECLSCQEYHVCKYLSVCFSFGVADYAAALLVFVHGSMSCSKGCYTCYTVVICQC